MTRYIPMYLCIIAALGGCAAVNGIGASLGLNDEIDLVSARAQKAFGEAAQKHCELNGRDLDSRRKMLEAINRAASPAKMFALDCNGDGQPDF